MTNSNGGLIPTGCVSKLKLTGFPCLDPHETCRWYVSCSLHDMYMQRRLWMWNPAPAWLPTVCFPLSVGLVEPAREWPPAGNEPNSSLRLSGPQLGTERAKLTCHTSERHAYLFNL